MKIIIETIPHKSQRYPTCGDWYYNEKGDLIIKVSQLSDVKYERLLAVHELVEALTCDIDGVTQQQVDQFDFKFEAELADRTKKGGDEPGDETDAPYKKQHCLATGVERILADRWGVDWKTYDRELYNLPYPKYLRAPKKKGD